MENESMSELFVTDIYINGVHANSSFIKYRLKIKS